MVEGSLADRAGLRSGDQLSQLCGQKIFIVVYDEQRKRLVQFSSNDDFEIKSAYNALNLIRQKDYCHNYEKFTNKDYKNLEETDFRSLRYKKEEAYTNNNNEIAEFEISHMSASEVQSVSSVCSKDRKLSKVEEWKTPMGEIESNQTFCLFQIWYCTLVPYDKSKAESFPKRLRAAV